MKSIKTAACAALLSTSFFSSPAFATEIPDQVANSTTTGSITTTCDALEATLDASGDYDVEGSITGQSSVQGTEILADRVIDQDSWAPSVGATANYNDIDASASSKLYRNGKSPNLFVKDALAGTVTWSANSYDFTGNYNITTTFEFTCHVTEHVAAVLPVYESENECVARVKVDGSIPSSYNKGFGAWCNEQTPDHSGNYDNRLKLVDGVDAHDNDDTGLDTTATIDQAGTALLAGHEDFGGVHTYTNQAVPVQTVVCISPGSKGGTWTAKNLYAGLGGTCSTATFNATAPGTIIPSASLPVI